MEALMPAILEQKVTGMEAHRAWASLLRAEGEEAPGPTPRPMRVPPLPRQVAGVASWRWHRWGVQPAQAATLMRVMQVAGRLEECGSLPVESARSRLSAVPGVGPWTVAEVGSRALGDPDALSVGDFHLAGQVVYAFTGADDGDDERMLELLAPFAGHRHRVQRLVETSGITRPRRGPRMAIPEHRRR
jgi:3-methyladenine DNA glycosylase/8-oxoguanine DNA glycosylase